MVGLQPVGIDFDGIEDAFVFFSLVRLFGKIVKRLKSVFLGRFLVRLSEESCRSVEINVTRGD